MTKFKMGLMALVASISMAFAGGNISPITVADETPVVIEAQNDFYVGGSFFATQVALPGEIDWFSTDAYNDIAYGLGVQAGYVFLRADNFSTAVEGRLGWDFGGSTLLDGDQFNYAILLKPAYDFGPVTGYVLAGWAGTQYSNITDWAAYGDDDISESGFAWGVGISTEIYDNFEVFADYLVKYDLGDESVLPYGDFDNDIISVGVNYKF